MVCFSPVQERPPQKHKGKCAYLILYIDKDSFFLLLSVSFVSERREGEKACQINLTEF